jgi:sugar lactone lactonase YvrE
MRFLLPLLFAALLVPSAWSRPVTYQRATSVLGQPNLTSDAVLELSDKTLGYPEFVAIEPVTGKVFVADSGAHRILRFTSVAAYQTYAAAEAVLGQPDFTSDAATDPPTASTLNSPGGMVFDSQGNLYVADYDNKRVLRWNNPTTIASGSPADVVIGQTDFTSKVSPGPGPHSGFNGPWVLAIDPSDNLYVGDYLLHRVLRFANAPSLTGNPDASAVFGQPNLAGSSIGTDPGTGPVLTTGILSYIWGLHLDPAGRLWVGDTSNNRVLRFDNAATKPSAALPDAVLGQPDFATDSNLTGATGLNTPFHLAMDTDGTLWVSDNGNARVLGYKNAGTRPATGANAADIVLGQPNFTSYVSGPVTDRGLGNPRGIAVTPAGGLLIADSDAARVVHFRNESPILQAALRKQIAAAKKALKKAKKARKTAQAKKLAKEIVSLNAQLLAAS